MKHMSDYPKNKRRMIRLALLLVSAVLEGLTLLFAELGLLSWIALVPFALALIDICEDASVRRRGLWAYGFFFFLAFFAVNFHWFIAMYPLDYIGGMTPLGAIGVVVAGCLGLAALQASGAAFLFVLFGEVYRTSFAKEHRWSIPVLAGGLWAILEWTQTLTWMGVPWARLAISQTKLLPLVQTASLFGCCFITFLIVCVNFSIACAFIFADKKKLFSILAAGVFIANASLGSVIYFMPEESQDSISVAAIQGNVTSQQRWTSELVANSIESHIELTRAAAEQGARVIVWPETMIPYGIAQNSSLGIRLSTLAKEYDVTLLIGAYSYDENGSPMNSIYTIFPDGSFSDTMYSKRHMVPFGEYVPLRDLLEFIFPPLTELTPLKDDMIAGKDSAIIEHSGIGFGSLICFDSIYDELSRESVLDGAEVLAISTNDSWFDGSAALDMHNAQSILRAIENCRYVIRAANTGISSLINTKGEIVSSLSAGTEGSLGGTLTANSQKTLYTYIGNSFVYLCILTYIVIIIAEKSKLIRRT